MLRRFGSFALCFTHGFDVVSYFCESGGDFFLARGEMFVECVSGGGESVVEMEGLDLEGDLALDVFEAEFAGGGVTGLDEVKEVAVGVVVEEGE